MTMSKDEKKRKFIDLTITDERLSKRHKQNDKPHSSDEENSGVYIAHVVHEINDSVQPMFLSTNEVMANTTTTTSPVAIQLDTEKNIEQLKQRVADKIIEGSEIVNFNREQYIGLYGKFDVLFSKRPTCSDQDGTSTTYEASKLLRLKLFFPTGEMVPNGAELRKVGRLTFCNGKQVIKGINLISGKIYFYLEEHPSKKNQLWATDLIPPHAVPVRTPGDYSTYNGRKVIQLCLTVYKEKSGHILRRDNTPDYSAHYEFHTKAINTINNTTLKSFMRVPPSQKKVIPLVPRSLNEEKKMLSTTGVQMTFPRSNESHTQTITVVNNTTINYVTPAPSSQKNFIPIVPNSLNEEKSNQSTIGIQNTFPIPSDFALFTAANKVLQFQVRKNESHTGIFPPPQIVVQENETSLPSFNNLLGSLGIFSSGNNRNPSLRAEEKEMAESNLNFQLES